jgi:transposase-like protein
VIDELLAVPVARRRSSAPAALAQLTKRLVERRCRWADRPPRLRAAPGAARRVGNTRNGSTAKTLATEHGPVERAPRVIGETFEPQIVRKGSALRGVDDKILALYSRGLRP